MKPRSTSVCIELDVDPVTDIESLESSHDPAFRHGLGDAHPCPFSDAPVTMRIEPLADPRCEQQRRRRLAHLPLHLGRVVLLLRAMPRQLAELARRGTARIVRRAPPSAGAA